MPNLIFPVGVPGSGKSTWARTILGDHFNIVSSDDIRREFWGSLRAAHDVDPEEKKRRNEKVWDTFYARITSFLGGGLNVYADGTNLRQFARGRLRMIANEAEAPIHCLIFNNVQEAWERNIQREHDLIVPEGVMLSFSGAFAKAYRDIMSKPTRYNSVTVIESLK